MEIKLTLHCFAGDPQSLAILLLGEYLQTKLAMRYLKPINLTEKLYKGSLTKTFPMLQIDQSDKPLFLERSMSILRYLARSAKSNSLYNESKNYEACIIDQALDSIYQEILPSALTLNAHNLGILELDKAQLAEVGKDLAQNLKGLEGAVARLPENVTLADFPLFALWVTLKKQPEAAKICGNLKNVEKRIDVISKDKVFGEIARPYLLRAK